MPSIVLFASGSGTNAENIVRYFRDGASVETSLLFSNKKSAGVLKRMDQLNVPTKLFNRKDFYENETVLGQLDSIQPDLIVLAGFLWLVPKEIIRAFPQKIINIHPALLPKYGGKGMYGSRVHDAVKENGDKESGITIHYVNEKYDEGATIFQATCAIDSDDTAKDIARKVHRLEYQHYPLVIEKLLSDISGGGDAT